MTTNAHASTRIAPERPWTLERITVHIVLILFVILALGPIAVVIINSLKTTPAIFGGPFALPNAETFSLDGYRRVFTRGNFIANYRNSLVVTVSSVAMTVIFSTLAAYALVEYRVRIVPLLAGLFIIGVMLPIRLGTIPIIQIMVAWHLMDTLTALILVYTAMSIPLAVTLMMTYFRTVPTELKEAARIDGANEWQTFLIAMPLVRPGLAAVATVTMLPIWNDLWFPLILAPSEATKTVTLGAQMFIGQYVTNWNAVLAALALAILPVLVLYLIFSRQLIRGITSGAVK